MTIHENRLESQRARHSIPAGVYFVDDVAVRSAGGGRGVFSFGIRRAGSRPHSCIDSWGCQRALLFAPMEPLAGTLRGVEPGDAASVGGLRTRPVWAVDIGRNGKVRGLARATEVSGLGVCYPPYPYHGAPQDREVYTVEEMRRKGHRY